MTENKRSGDSSPSGVSQFLVDNIQQVLGLIGGLAGTAGLLYALGFLIVNLYLLSFGVYEVGLLRERFISAGAAFILIMAVIGVIWWLLIPNVLDRILDNLPRSLSRGVFSRWVFVFLFIIWVTLCISLMTTSFLGWLWNTSSDLSDWVRLGVSSGDVAFWHERWNTFVTNRPMFSWLLMVNVIFAMWRLTDPKMVEATSHDQAAEGEEDAEGDNAAPSSGGGPVGKPKIPKRRGYYILVTVILFWFLLVNVIFAMWRLITGPKKVEETFEVTDDQVAEGDEDKEAEDAEGGNAAPSSGGDPVGKPRIPKWRGYYILVIVILFLTLAVYARNVYPLIPAAMGGGRPFLVQFTVRGAQDLQALVQMGTPVEEGENHITGRIALVAQTDNSYIVIVPHSELKQNMAVSIPKDHIDGILYHLADFFNDIYVVETWTQYGTYALAQGDYQTAIEMFDKAVYRKSNYTPAYIGLGDAFLAQYIDQGTLCVGAECSIDNAIKSYKVMLNQSGNGQRSGDDRVPATDASFFAEVFYKLARAYALAPREEVDVDFLCFPLMEDDSPGMVRPYQATTYALECAIKLDEQASTPRNYREAARSDEVFHLLGADLRTDAEFLMLIFPTLVDALSEYIQEADNLKELGQTEEAIDRYTWAIAILTEEELDLVDPEIEMARLYINRASLYLQLHKQESPLCEYAYCLDIAIHDYSHAVHLEPNNAAHLTSLADAHRLASNTETAVEIYRRVTEKEELSDYAPAWLGLGETYLLQAEYLLAREAFNEVIALQSGNAAAYYGRAVAEALIGEDMEQVIVDLRQAITLDETYRKRALEEPAFALIIDIEGLLTAERLFDAGQTGEREGTLEDAIQYYLEAIKLDPVNDTYHAALAEAYTQLPMPNWNEAERAYLRAIELSVDNDNYYFKLAEVYAAQGKYEQAIESLETAIELKGDKAIYYDRLSAVLFKSGLLDEALIAGEAAIDLEPENLDYRFHLAEIYRQIESWDQAKTYYDQIIEVDPEYGDAHCGLAIVQYQTGDGEGATAKLAGCMALSDNQNLKDQTELARTTFELRQDGSDDGD